MLQNILQSKKTTDSKLSFYDSALLVNADHWNEVVKKSNIYLSLEYLEALELSMVGVIEPRYIIFYNNLFEPIAVAYLQIVHFVDEGLKYPELICKIRDRIKNKFLKSLQAKVLVCGNIFASGENGFLFSSKVTYKEAFNMLTEGMKRLTQEEEVNGQVSFTLLKEYWPNSFGYSDFLKEANFKDFMIDVNMVMNISPAWKTIDDYLSAMNTKFRTKAKGVYKKSNEVKAIDFELNDIEKNILKIEELYKAVLSKAEYNFAKLNRSAFHNFKKNLKGQFIFRAYFLKSQMVGFSSAFNYNGVIDANYVGIDYNYNKDYAIYQRMLYDFVELSINLKAHELRLGRTAELIKSSVGALPVNMKLYVKHRNSISNKLLGPFVSSITPSKFEIRSPFKEDKN